MPFKQFDREKLILKSLQERIHDVDISIVKPLDLNLELIKDEKYDSLSEKIVIAKSHKSTVLMMYGAHVIRKGNALYMIEMMKKGLITHFATNGAGAIHDFELSLIGATCESVAKYVSQGQFGLWRETGLINEIVKDGVKDGLGLGEAVGRYIWENQLPHREKSVLAMAYKLQVPCTVHVGIGNDIIHEHPNCDGGVIGKASYTDFLIYAQSITRLEKGVFLNFGSAVTGPEVYLKALAMARNVAHQQHKSISDFTTAVFDLLPMVDQTLQEVPPKTDPMYYFRPWKTILARTVKEGGKSYYIWGDHGDTVPNLAVRALKLDQSNVGV